MPENAVDIGTSSNALSIAFKLLLGRPSQTFSSSESEISKSCKYVSAFLSMYPSNVSAIASSIVLTDVPVPAVDMVFSSGSGGAAAASKNSGTEAKDTLAGNECFFDLPLFIDEIDPGEESLLRNILALRAASSSENFGVEASNS